MEKYEQLCQNYPFVSGALDWLPFLSGALDWFWLHYKEDNSAVFVSASLLSGSGGGFVALCGANHMAATVFQFSTDFYQTVNIFSHS